MPTPLEFTNFWLGHVRHSKQLGIRAIDASKEHILLELPFDERLVGNPETGVIHGGALTTLMDSACGLSVQLALENVEICPTLDLRIDYVTAAVTGLSVFGRASVYRLTDNVVFARGMAFQQLDGGERPIAHCVATFMRLPAELGARTAYVPATDH